MKHKKLFFFQLPLMILAILIANTFRVARVTGISMEPTYHDGDRLLYCRVIKPYAGAVVIATDPEDNSSVLIKRVEKIEGDEVYLLGDNRDHSEDSRSFGPVNSSQIKGVVLSSKAYLSSD